MQLPGGEWPRQEMTGVFFRTALLEYRLYRQYFPLWALALAERRRLAQEPLREAAVRAPAAATGTGTGD